MAVDEHGQQIDELELRVGERVFRTWESVSIARSLDQASGTFRLVVSGDEAWPIPPSTPVQLVVDDVPVLTGQVDSHEVEYSSAIDRIALSGRDSTADLVDCSATNPTGEVVGYTAGEIAAWIAEPFGIEAVNDFPILGSEIPIPRFAIRPGETAWGSIERAVRMRGQLAYPDGKGRLIVERPVGNFSGAALVSGPGGKVLSARLSHTHAARFQTYQVLGQGSGSDTASGALVAGVEGTATDGEIERFRPLVVIAPGQVTPADAQALAQWEASWRAAQSRRLQVVVQGWRRAPRKAPWALNEIVRTTIPKLGVSGHLLINAVQFQRGPQGTTTTLELVRLSAYQPKPEVEPPEGFLDLGDLEGSGG